MEHTFLPSTQEVEDIGPLATLGHWAKLSIPVIDLIVNKKLLFEGITSKNITVF